MNIRSTAILVLLPVMLGCTSDVSLWQNDNPKIHRLQAEETVRHIDDQAARALMKKYIGDRVSFVFPVAVNEPTDSPGGSIAGGRAAALTSDGYFLTAYHVVQNHSFHIQKTEMIRRPPRNFNISDIGNYYSNDRYPGRLVWCNPDIDLAILKFPVENWPTFKEIKFPPQQGETVFTADNEGYSLAVNTVDNAMGNGAFFAAGTVRDTAKQDARTQSLQFATTLVARGGMSGSPLVTADHDLCGIICRIEGLAPFQTPRTVAVMIRPGYMSKIIESDRNKQEANQHMDPTR